jgi:predicted CXXCH cytochrome family protein
MWQITKVLALLTIVSGVALAEEKIDSCVACHALLPEQLGAPVAGMKQDVHTQYGFSCADCHGGDPSDMDLAAMTPERGFRGKPTPGDVPNLCGRCHSDAEFMRRYNPALPTNQRERYWTSVHGKRLAAGDTKVAICTSCHGVHGIKAGRQADSPVYRANVPSTCGQCHSKPDYMAGYDIPTDQEERYRRSVHGELLLRKRDLSAPTCTTCHDNHGASPPGLTSIAEVCGQCHVNNSTFFIASPHKPAFDQLQLPECVTCHSNHEVRRTSDAMLGVTDGALCSQCHASDSKGYAAAREMRQTIDHLKEAMQTADSTLHHAEELGMEVGDARYEFHNASAMLIQARTSIHRFSAPYVKEVAAPGLELAQRTERSAAAAAAEAQARRRNLLAPMAILAVLMILLAVKLRRLEKGINGNTPP